MITQEAVIDIAREAIYTMIITSAPLLIVSLVVGLIYSRPLHPFRNRHSHLYQRSLQCL